MAIMEVDNITIKFGGLTAVKDFSLKLESNEVLAIIGPNGAGKTTVFNMLTGMYQPTSGTIYINGKDMTNKKSHVFANNGMARTFQNIRLFGDISVLDNLITAQVCNTKTSLLKSVLRTNEFKREQDQLVENAMNILHMFDLDHKADFLAKKLPYGEQRKLEIARALVKNPQVLLLDEPCAGMVQSEIDGVIGFIRDIRQKFQISIILIEHHMSMVMSIADRIKVLDFGETIAEGLPAEIQNDRKVIEAYLGGEYVNAKDK